MKKMTNVAVILTCAVNGIAVIESGGGRRMGQ